MNVNLSKKDLLSSAISFRHPVAEDAHEVYRLVQRSPPLDQNSLYCNLLQCSHFSHSAMAAFAEGVLVGFVSAYIKPSSEGAGKTLFVWQVMVAEAARGLGIASRMLRRLLDAESARDLRFIETTVTADNTSSQALFEKLAASLATELEKSAMFDKERHFHQQHDSEILFRIGPI